MDTDRLLLIVEDDEAFARTLTRSFERRGNRVLRTDGLQGVEALLPAHTPEFAVVDLKLKGEASGLACVRALHAHSEAMRIVVLTGFASIATAVEAIKLGASHYLAKPSNTDDIEAAFGLDEGNTEVALTKLDCLSGMPDLKICVAYEGANTENPIWPQTAGLKPVYESMEAWSEDISHIRKFEDLPKAAQHYVLRIEALLGRKIKCEMPPDELLQAVPRKAH